MLICSAWVYSPLEKRSNRLSCSAWVYSPAEHKVQQAKLLFQARGSVVLQHLTARFVCSPAANRNCPNLAHTWFSTIFCFSRAPVCNSLPTQIRAVTNFKPFRLCSGCSEVYHGSGYWYPKRQIFRSEQIHHNNLQSTSRNKKVWYFSWKWKQTMVLH